MGVLAPLPLQGKGTPNLVIDVVRTAKVGQYGVVHVDDNFSILNNGTEPVSSLDFGFSRMYRDDFYYAEANDSQGRKLSLEADVNSTSEFYWIRANFAQELDFNRTYNFTVTSVLYGVITPVEAGFEYNFTAAPVLEQDANFANVTFVAVQGSDFRIAPNSTYVTTVFSSFPALFHEYKPWKAYSNQTFYAPYATVNQYILDLKSAERNIMIGNFGTLNVKDTYRFYNPSVAVDSLTITLPDGASNIMAYDQVGAMWATPENPGPPYQVTVKPRYTLGIRSKENFTFSLTYDLPQSKYLKQLTWWGSYNLTLSLLGNKEDFLFQKATARITTPPGMTVTGLRIAPQSAAAYPVQVEQNQTSFRLQGVTDMNDLQFSVTVGYLPFWSAFEAFPWILGLEIAIIAFAIVAKFRRGPQLEVPVPVERLREFVGLYDERLALSREIAMMEEDVARGGLTKHEFRRRKKVMEFRLDELNKLLMDVKVELRAMSSRYDEMIRRIDRAEAEIEASRASMNQVRGQYRAGKSTRETYDTMVAEISKRIDRAEETVETILITLREEAR